ncbi:MAG: helix-turn-helix transcriptional regulator [Oscillospiraceae bacterium]|nr:helix-turn-helix transcriptional regulator [Oscillospiraceae bacterium]
MSIGQRIKQARENKGMTQEEVAKLCNTTKQTIFKYESETVTNIPYEKIVLLSKALSVSPSYLFEWEKEQPSVPGGLSLDGITETQRFIIEEVLKMPEDRQRALAKILGISE